MTKAGKNVTDIVTHSVNDAPRPRIRTSSGVSATSGMVCVTSARGIKASMARGINREEIAKTKAKPNPAAIPVRVIGRVSNKAATRRACALSAVVAKNR